MPVSLPKDLRTQLARTTLEARKRAEAAARAALEHLAVHEAAPREHMSEAQRTLRKRLRARARALGDELKADQSQQIQQLLELVAYEAWHRLLFTRFLTENNLLHTDKANGSVPVSLSECDSLAHELHARDGLELACRFAQEILPGVFRSGDPSLDLRLAIDDDIALRNLLNTIPHAVFQADDALGWTYQFWQQLRKEEINASGSKIGAREISPVTQLFTEDYMVEFLLHNTLGAWWAGKQGPIVAASEQQARDHVGLAENDGLAVVWTYLRFVQDATTHTWTPAAGTFAGWPTTARAITFLDPCMGSGHFLVFALPLLARLRMQEEDLPIKDAIVATLRDNIHGLELDERCSQIAAFSLALTAWKLGGFQPLPELHLACSGLALHATQDEWMALAGDNYKLRNGMARLHELFENAPVLGSLINPRSSGSEFLDGNFHDLQPLLEKALAQEATDDTAHEMAVTARGLAKAAEMLAGQFTLVATNVPYLGNSNFGPELRSYLDRDYKDTRYDLANVMLDRCLKLLSAQGNFWGVLPHGWLFLKRFSSFRQRVLTQNTLLSIVRLGEGAFESQQAAGAFICFVGLGNAQPQNDHTFSSLDISSGLTPQDKASGLRCHAVSRLLQSAQTGNPDAIIRAELSSGLARLEQYVSALSGVSTGALERFSRFFWEVQTNDKAWEFIQSSVDETQNYGGRTNVIFWEMEHGQLYQYAQSVKHLNHAAQNWLRGKPNWGKQGVCVSKMRFLKTSLYGGNIYDENCCALIPFDCSILAALWCFCSSSEYSSEVRKINQSILVQTKYLIKIPFDLAHWQQVAAEKYPDGLPKPFSSDATQWLFNGHPAGADQPLQVAVARLLGYQWPRQTGSSFPDCPALGPDGLETFADDDGIVCLPAVLRELPAAQRLRELLAQALGTFDESGLLAQAGAASQNLEQWLRDEFFTQHCALFHHRPFIWHIWDGRADGFHALVNYHKLDHDTLKKLTYSYLGEWIKFQNDEAKADKPGAAEREAAAKELEQQLEKILEGEAPYDIFVRWKPVDKQAIGWNPDINDGVRLNIRPFMLAEDMGKKGAGLLRAKPNIKWDKDRGKEPERAATDYPWFWCEGEPTKTDPEPGTTFTGNRWNSVHLSLEAKRKAR